MLAGVGCGLYADIPDGIGRAVRVVRRYEVDGTSSADLAAVYERYRAVVEALLAINAPEAVPKEQARATDHHRCDCFGAEGRSG